VLIYHSLDSKSKKISYEKEGHTMVTENEALVIIEEGTDVEAHTESMLCCFAAFLFIH